MDTRNIPERDVDPGVEALDDMAATQRAAALSQRLADIWRREGAVTGRNKFLGKMWAGWQADGGPVALCKSARVSRRALDEMERRGEEGGGG